MFDLSALIVAAFATFRLAELLCIDDGPGDVFFRLRVRLGVYDLVEIGDDRKPATWHGRLFACPWCLGMWIALLLAVVFDRSVLLPVTWFAIAGGQALLQAIGGRQP